MEIIKGVQKHPRRVLLYGVAGIGKSTWASKAPKPIFIQTEDGLNGIDCERFPVAASFRDVMAAIEHLYTQPHEYRTLALDSLDWLERLIWAQVCGEKHVKSIEDIGYAKGYVFALTYWREVLEGLTALREKHSLTTVLIAHAKIEKFENPETDPYDRFSPRLHKAASALVQEWCDEVLFANYKVYTSKAGAGFNQDRFKAIGTGERILRTSERPAHVAKNRCGLPDEIAMDWNEYARLAGIE